MNRNRWSTLILTTLACAVVGQAQQGQTSGAIRGQVFSRSGGKLAGATVVVRNLETSFSRTLMTGADGAYTAPLLPVGPYEITVTAPGMKTLKDNTLRVNLGSAAVLNFTLDAAVVGATVEVVDTRQSLDVAQVNTTAQVDQKIVEAIPLVSRNFQDLARMTPGVMGGAGNPPRLIVEGARQIFNAVQIDGANNNSTFFGEQRGGAFIPFTFGADTIRELQIITNGYDSQYGQAGATINAVTKNGTNEFTGSVLFEMRKTSWAARATRVPYDPSNNINTFSNLQRYNDSQNLNFNVGGPIFKDKLFFYAGVETFTRDRTANPILPSLSTTASTGNTLSDFNNFRASQLGLSIANLSGITIAQEFGNPFPVDPVLNPNGGTPSHPYKVDATNTVYFARLDYSLNESHRFVLRSNYTVLDDTALNTSQNLNNGESNIISDKISAISWVLEANDIWSSNLFSESRLQLSREARPMRANAVVGTPSIQVARGMTVGTKTSTPRESNELITQFFHQTTFNPGDWTFKGGVDYMKTDVDNQFFQNNSGNFVFDSYAGAAAWASGTLAAGTPGNISYSGAISPYKGRIEMWTKTLSAFAQASYSGLFSKRLNLNLGVRYTKQDFSDNPAANPNFKGLDQAIGATAVDPRFAFSFDLDGKGTTILRGGHGWFSSPTPLLLHSNTMTGNAQIITNYSYALGTGAGRTAGNLAIFNSGLLSASSMISGTSVNKVSDAGLLSLAGSFPAGGASATSLWDPNNKLSRSKKSTLGIERDMGNQLVVGAKVTYIRYENLQYFENINLNQGNVAAGLAVAYNDGYATSLNSWSRVNRPNYAVIRGRRVEFGPGSLVAGNPVSGFGDVFLVKSDGYGQYNGLTLTLDKKLGEQAGLTANVTFSRSKDTSSFERGTYGSGFSSGTMSPFGEIGASQLPDPQNPDSNFGISNNDRLVVFNAVAYFPVVFGIQASFRYLFQTGLPYTAFDGRDNNGDGVANEFATGRRNSERQPNQQQIDMRISRTFKIYKKLQVEGIVDVYNLLNTANQSISTNNQFATYGPAFNNGTAGAANVGYGQVDTPDFNTRELQVGVRFKF